MFDLVPGKMNSVPSPYSVTSVESPGSTSSQGSTSSLQITEPKATTHLIVIPQDFGKYIVTQPPPPSGAPYLSIVEQPQSKFRFRYKSEMMGTHGSLVGENSDRVRKTYPAVQLMNYSAGNAVIRCTLYTAAGIRRVPHAHRLMIHAKAGDRDEPHDAYVSQENDYMATFPGMTILHTAKRDVTEQLIAKKKKRLADTASLRMIDEMKIREEAEFESRHMNLNSVSLCFEAFVPNQQGGMTSLNIPVYSNPINNMKSALTGELKICRIDKTVSSCLGNEEVFILVEKVGKKNIKVKFFELDEEDNEIWSDYGKFSELDVHHQYAIVFRTPRYRDTEIENPVEVFLQLYRPTDGGCSEPIRFKYKPKDAVGRTPRKRARQSVSSSSEVPIGIVVGKVQHNMTGISNQVNLQLNGMRGQGVGDEPMIMEPFVSTNTNEVWQEPSNKSLGVSADDILAEASHQFNSGPTISFEEVLKNLESLGPVSPACQLPLEITSSDSRTAFFNGNRRYFDKSLDVENDVTSTMGLNLDLTDLVTDSAPVRDPKKSKAKLPENIKKDKQTSMEEKSKTPRETENKLICRGAEDIREQFSKVSIKKTNPEILSSKSPAAIQDAVSSSDTAKKTVGMAKPQGKPVTKLLLKEMSDSDKIVIHSDTLAQDVVQRVTKILNSNLSVEAVMEKLKKIFYLKTEDGNNAIHCAVMNGQRYFLVQMLVMLNNRPYINAINATNSKKQTPLHLAVLHNETKMVKMLVRSEANPNAVDTAGNSTLHLAALHSHSECLKELLNKNNYVDSRYKAELNLRNYEGGLTPFHLAVLSQDLTSVKMLVDAGVDVNESDGTLSRTALHMAVEKKDMEITKFLLEKTKINVNHQNLSGNSALHIACALQSLELCEILLDAKADPMLRNHTRQQRCKTVQYVKSDEGEMIEIKQEEEEEDDTEEDESIPTEQNEEYIGETPLELAQGNDKLVELLHNRLVAEQKEEIIEIKEESPEPTESGAFDSETLHKLARVLDPPSRSWEYLAELLDCRFLVPTLKDVLSPTKFLFGYLDLHDKVSIPNVRNLLEALDEHEAVSIIDEMLTKKLLKEKGTSA